MHSKKELSYAKALLLPNYYSLLELSRALITIAAITYLDFSLKVTFFYSLDLVGFLGG